VHKIVVQADDYPESQTTFAVTGEKENVLDLEMTMSGFGSIHGQVFYKTLDNPIHKHPIYMPTVKSALINPKVQTDEKGNFYFTNLTPGSYELRASFLEKLDLDNSVIKVKEGETLRIQVILNIKLPGTKTKY
jgi:hypothetical protein